MRLVYRSALVIGLAAAIASCGKSSTSPSTPAGSNSANGAAIDIPASDVYGQTNFNPGQVNIVVGSAVSFQNSDGIEHHPTADDGSWNIDLTSGSGGSHSFLTAGTYTYHCSIHPNMTGMVFVK